jgi:hypothetical protein
MKIDLKIADLIDVPPVQTVIRLADGSGQSESIMGSFVFTSDVSNHVSILTDALAKKNGRGFFLQGDFGSGKSHFLATLSGWLSKRPGYDELQSRHAGLARISDSGRKFLPVDISLVKNRAGRPLEQIIIESTENALSDNGIHETLTPRATFLTALKSLLKNPDRAAEFAEYAGISETVDAFIVSQPKAAYIQGVGFYKHLGMTAPEMLVEDRHETFARAIRSVRDAGFDGLVLIIDELSEYFRSKPDARSLNEDARTLQLLGELSETEPIWIIAAVQESIERTGDISQVTFLKIKDRFPVKFVLSTVHITALISQRLVRRKPGSEATLAKIHRYLQGHFPSFDHSLETFLDTYPVHPDTILLLNGLGDLFSEHRGIVDYVHSRIAGDPGRQIKGILDRPAYELLAPDSIYDHFSIRMAEFSAFNVYPRHIIPHLEEVIDSILEKPEDRHLSRRIIRILVLHAIHPTAKSPAVRRVAEWTAFTIWDHDPGMNVQFIAEALLDPLVEESRFLLKHRAQSGDPFDTVYEITIRENPAKVLKARIDRVASDLPADDTRLFLMPLTQMEASASWPGPAVFQEGLLRMISWRNTSRRGRVIFLTPGREAEIENNLSQKIQSGDVDFAMVIGAGAFDFSLPNTAVWKMPVLSDEGALKTLKEFAAANLVADGLKATNPADAPLMEPAAETIEKLAPAAQQAALYLFYCGQFSDHRIPVEPVIKKIKRFDRLLEWAGEVLLDDRYPGFRDIAPRNIRPSPLDYQRLIDEFVSPGTLTLQKAHAKKLSDAIEGLAKPLGLVELRSGTYIFSPDPDSHPLLSSVFGLIRAAGDTRLSDVMFSLKTGKYGMTEDAIRFLFSALAHGGLITLIKNGRAVPVEMLGLTRIESVDQVAPGEVIGRHDRETLMHECPFLAPAEGWQSFGLRQQREAWRQVVKFGKWAQQTKELQNRMRSHSDFNAFEAFELKNLTAKLETIQNLAQAIRPSLQAREGLKQFLTAWRSSGIKASDIDYLKKFQNFFTRNADRIIFINHYLQNEIVKKFISADIDLAGMEQDIGELLAQPEQIVVGGEMSRLNDAFERFRSSYLEYYRRAHDAYYSALGKKSFSRFTERAIDILRKLGAVEILDRPEGSEALLKKIDSPTAPVCKKNLTEELTRSPVCGCGFLPGTDQSTPDSNDDIESAIESMLKRYLHILSRPEIKEALAARAFALKDAKPGSAGRLKSMIDLIGSDHPAPSALMDILDSGTAAEIDKALSRRVPIEKRNVNDLMYQLNGRRLASSQIMETVRAWVAESDDSKVIALNAASESGVSRDPDALSWWPMLHPELFQDDPGYANSSLANQLESSLESHYPSSALQKKLVFSDDKTLLRFIMEERFHTGALRSAWLLFAERIISGADWPGKPGIRSRHIDPKINGQVVLRLSSLKQISQFKHKFFPDSLRIRIPISEIITDAWVSKELRDLTLKKLQNLHNRGADWMATLPPTPVIDLDDDPIVIILDGVSPDVWLEIPDGLNIDPDHVNYSWSRLEAEPKTAPAISSLFGFSGDPYDEFAARGVAYHQLKGNEENKFSDILPVFSKNQAAVIRVSLLDETAHAAYLALADMPGAVIDLLNHILPAIIETYTNSDNRKLILTTDHGLSLESGRLVHGKGGVFEKAIFRAEWE